LAGRWVGGHRWPAPRTGDVVWYFFLGCPLPGRPSARRAAAATARARRPRGVGPRALACGSGPSVARPLRRRRARNGPGVVKTQRPRRSVLLRRLACVGRVPDLECLLSLESFATKAVSRESRHSPPSDHLTASIPRLAAVFSSQCAAPRRPWTSRAVPMPSHDRSPGLRWPARQVNAGLDSYSLGASCQRL